MHACSRVGPTALLSFALLAAIATPAGAQTSLQVPLQFDFINPGAKSLSLAGAFVGLADDATAAFANPAGLTFLAGPEVSIEFRGGTIDTPYLKRGRTSGTPSGIGIDTIDGVQYANSAGRLAGIGYASFVYPARSGRWVVAGYRHELARIDQSFSSDGVFGQDVAEFTPRRDAPQDGTRRVTITGYGAAAAYKPVRTVSIGLAIVAYHFDFDSEFKRYFVDAFFEAPNRNVPRDSLYKYSAQRGTDTSLAPVIGITIDRGRVRAGALYRRGASFGFDTTANDGSGVRNAFRVPHTASVGVSVRPAAPWIVTGEVTRITYGRLAHDFVSSQAEGRTADFVIHDGTEVHGAVQYAWRRASGPPIRLRGGAWFDPDHSVQYAPVNAPTSASARIEAETFAAALRNGGNQIHGTAGVGVTVSRNTELNAGVDLARTVKLLSVSLIVHLGGRTP